MELEPIFILGIIFGVPCLTLVSLVCGPLGIYLSYKAKNRELDLRELEIKLRVIEARRDGKLPAWLDTRDPMAVLEWQKAKAELDLLAAVG